METYYNPEDLAKFGTMGEEAPKLWENFMQYYTLYLKKVH